MLSPSDFRDLVSGTRKGPFAGMARAGLRLAEVPYTWAVRWRNRRYDRGSAKVHAIPVPVVSVGNLTLGGTGKTPMVAWFARQLRARGLRVALVSRGYGVEAGAVNDEAMEIERRLPDVPHLQNPDRVAAALLAIEECGSEVLVLDDAFQHRRIARNLDLVMLDALEPFGFGHVFPRGMLREPLGGLARADVVVLSRADMIDSRRREEIRSEVARRSPHAGWAEVVHSPCEWISSQGATQPLESLAKESVYAFCGIGNPLGFRRTLEGCGVRLAAFREFPDHHHYGRADVERLATGAEESGAAAVVCTHKDLVKIGAQRLGNRPLWALTVAIEFLSGRDALQARLEACLSSC